MTLPHFGPPPDPVYVRFAEGLTKYFDDIHKGDPVRWNPAEGDWRSYSPTKFWLVEVSVPGTDPGSTIDLAFKDNPWRSSLAVQEWQLPDLFAKIQAHYGKYSRQFPTLVWNPITGEWRQYKSTTGTQPGPTPPPDRCRQMLLKTDQLLREGLITAAEASLRRTEILRICQ